MLKRQLLITFIAGSVFAGCTDTDRSMLYLQPHPPASVVLVTDPPPMDVSGTWYASIQQNAVNCDAGEYVDAKTLFIAQDDTEITMLTSTGDTYVGNVNGDIVEWFGSFDERGGTANFTAATMVFSADTGAGDAAWTWSNGTESCNGTMSLSVSRDAIADSGSNSWPSIADPFAFTDNVAFFRGSLGVDGDSHDFFAFTAGVDARVQVELSHFDTSVADLNLVMLDENETEIAYAGTTDSFEIVEVDVQAGSTYYVWVEGALVPGAVAYDLAIDSN